MTKIVSSINKQIRFLIMLTILDDKDYQKEGIKVDNLMVALIENKPLWMKVGKLDEKKWKERLNGELSILERKKFALRRSSTGKYFSGKKFESFLMELVMELSDYLELDIEKNELMVNGNLSEEDILKGIQDYSIPHYIIDQDEGTKRNMLTHNQSVRLVQLSYQYGYL